MTMPTGRTLQVHEASGSQVAPAVLITCHCWFSIHMFVRVLSFVYLLKAFRYGCYLASLLAIRERDTARLLGDVLCGSAASAEAIRQLSPVQATDGIKYDIAH